MDFSNFGVSLALFLCISGFHLFALSSLSYLIKLLCEFNLGYRTTLHSSVKNKLSVLILLFIMYSANLSLLSSWSFVRWKVFITLSGLVNPIFKILFTVEWLILVLYFSKKSFVSLLDEEPSLPTIFTFTLPYQMHYNILLWVRIISFSSTKTANTFLATKAFPRRISTACSATVPCIFWEGNAAAVLLTQKRV